MRPSLERTAIWLAYSKRCAYCGAPIEFRELEIDHILPDSLQNEPGKLAALREKLQLPSGFQLSFAANLLPAHGLCNLRKTDNVFNESTARYYISLAESKRSQIDEIKSKLEIQSAKESLLSSVRIALESGNLSMSELTNTVSNVKGFPLSTRIEFVDGEWDGDLSNNELEALLDRPVLLGKSKEIDGIELVNGQNDSVRVRTCREYRSAKSAGYYALTTFAMKMVAFLEAADAILSAVRDARLPKISYFENPRVGISDLALLTNSLLPWFGPDYEEMLLETNGKTLRELSLEGKISIIDVSSSHLNFVYSGCGAHIKELLRADLDGDGLEEILIQYYLYAVGGTLGVAWIGVLRRPSQSALFEYQLRIF